MKIDIDNLTKRELQKESARALSTMQTTITYISLTKKHITIVKTGTKPLLNGMWNNTEICQVESVREKK